MKKTPAHKPNNYQPLRPPGPLAIPVYLQSPEVEEEFWRRVASSRGMTLEQFDRRCGVLPLDGGRG